jgi:hypothetical protein
VADKVKHMQQLIKVDQMLMSVPECSDSDYADLPVPDDLKQEVFAEQKGLCLRCTVDTPTLYIHKVRPDGPPVKANVVGLCTWCRADVMWRLHKVLGYRKHPRFMGA